MYDQHTHTHKRQFMYQNIKEHLTEHRFLYVIYVANHSR